jgi:FlaA1/EpsC-like NDP-sugar epimerase
MRPGENVPGESDIAVEHRYDHQRQVAQAALDAGAWVAATYAAMLLRFDGSPPAHAWDVALLVGVVCALAHVSLGFGLLLYRGRYRFGSFDEVFGVAVTTFVVSLVAFLAVAVVQPADVPRSVPLIAGGMALVLMLGGRFVLRGYREHMLGRAHGDATLIYGAGDTGEQLARQMRQTYNSAFRPVGFLEDDPAKSRLTMHGVRVLGTSLDLEEAVRKTEATVVVVAIADVTSSTLIDLDRRCQQMGVSLRVIPSASMLVHGTVALTDIKHVSEEDLLGRSVTDIDLTQIGELLHGRRVLITGAGGSIGSELARQVSRFEPAALGLLDRDENGLHTTQLSITGRALFDDGSAILASIRDVDRLDEVFTTFQPDIVFHAAALKHLPLLETYPSEAVKTNVIGTLNVLRACQAAGVGTFVNISTDKAANPISVLGYSKRITERLTATVGAESAGTYVSVRFGNVLGSHGSVLLTFTGQIEAGGPVTVTHPDVTRYFMTIPEAVQLVLQAAAIGDDGEVLVLDMGEPVRIADVASQLIKSSGKHVGILFTGLRPGEKLEEDLLGDGEEDLRPQHPLITQAHVPTIDIEPLLMIDNTGSHDHVREALRVHSWGVREEAPVSES